MQLKFKRYTGTKGVLRQSTSYQLEAMIQPSPEERERVERFGRWAAYIAKSCDTDFSNNAEMRDQIGLTTFRDLSDGCKFSYADPDNVVLTENVLVEACKNLIANVNFLMTFDHSERVFEIGESSSELLVKSLAFMTLLLIIVVIAVGMWVMGHFSGDSISGLRSAELRDLQQRHDRLAHSLYPDIPRMEGLLEAFFEALDYDLAVPLRACFRQIIAEEKFTPMQDLASLDFKQQIELKSRLRQWEMKATDGQEVAADFLIPCFVSLGEHLPKTQAPSPFTIPLIYVIPNAGNWISSIYGRLFDARYQDRELFTNLRTQLYLNLCRASDVEPNTEPRRKMRYAHESGLSPSELNRTYLRGTPFFDLFNTPVPLKLTHAERFNHWHVLAGSGQGKTMLIENVVRYDVASEDPPSIVLIDPHSDLVRRLVKSDMGIEIGSS